MTFTFVTVATLSTSVGAVPPKSAGVLLAGIEQGRRAQTGKGKERSIVQLGQIASGNNEMGNCR